MAQVKRAEMGLGTLIIFIALLLAVAIAAGILIQTTGSIQEKSLTTGSEAKNQLATNIHVTEIFGSDGTTGSLTDFVVSAKISPGSEPIKFTDLLVTIGSNQGSASLSFRGIGASIERGAAGYMTFSAQEIGELSVYEDPMTQNVAQTRRVLSIDLDADGVNDTVETCRYLTNCLSFVTTGTMDGRYLLFNLSSYGEVYVPMLYPNGTCCTDTRFLGQDYFGGHLDITGQGQVFGTVLLTGQTTGSTQVHADNIRIYTKKVLIDDLDDDGEDDYLALDKENILFLMGNGDILTIPLSQSIASGGAVQDVSAPLYGLDGTYLADVVLEGTTSLRWIVDEDLTFTITPSIRDRGYFSVEYLRESPNHIPGIIDKGDIARFYFESAGPVGENEEIWIRLIPKVGSPSNMLLLTPDVMFDQNVYLFP